MRVLWIIIIVLLLSGCHQARNIVCQNAEDEAPESSEEAMDEPMPLETLTIERRDISSEKIYPASIEGRQSVKIIPRIDGYLREVRVKEGARVQRGQVLFVMDQAAYQSEVTAAKANVSVAKSGVTAAQLNYDSRKNLREKNIISEHELLTALSSLEAAKAQLEQANAQLDAAQTNLAYTTLKSPIHGIVGKVPCHVGDYVGPSQNDGLAVVADIDEMYVNFSLTERDIVRRMAEYGSLDAMIAAFPQVSLRMVDGSDYKIKGRIETMSGILDNETGTLSVRAVFPNPDGMLLSGGTAQLVIPDEYKDAIVIPQAATFNILDKTHVYIVVNGRTQLRLVQVIPMADGQNYLVKSGLNEGDIIVASGVAYLQDDMEVTSAQDDEEDSKHNNIKDDSDNINNNAIDGGGDV